MIEDPYKIHENTAVEVRSLENFVVPKRGRGVQHTGALLLKSSQKFSETHLSRNLFPRDSAKLLQTRA